jgi:sigma-B regulation protein RsbU (phosphoserine phosphatase)
MSAQHPKNQNNLLQLEKELAQRETELSIINSVQEGLAAHLETQQIFNLVGDKIREITDAQVVMISVYDQQTNTVEHRYAIEMGEHILFPGPHPPGGFRSKIIESGQPYLVNRDVGDVAARMGQPTIPGTVTPKSWLGVPMFVGGRVSGVLSLQNIERENVFSQSDIRLLQTLANAMSVALENARLYEQEHLYRKSLEREFEIGRKIQAGFLPDTIPQPDGWEIAASLRPAREVAGDFYDVFELPGGLICLVIGDVCDKGLGAALFMTLFRSLLRAGSNFDFYTRVTNSEKSSPGSRLKEAILLTNNYIAETHGDTSMFATLFVGILDPMNGKLIYINGGHIPPLLLDANGLIAALTRTGPAVGAFADIEYKVAEVEIQPGSLLFAYTDGLTDTVNPDGKCFDQMESLSFFVETTPLHQAVEKLQEQCCKFSMSETLMDDITLLAIRRKMNSRKETG